MQGRATSHVNRGYVDDGDHRQNQDFNTDFKPKDDIGWSSGKSNGSSSRGSTSSHYVMDGTTTKSESRYIVDGVMDPNVEEKLNLGIQMGHLQTRKRENRVKKQRSILRILLVVVGLMVCAVIALGLALYYIIDSK